MLDYTYNVKSTEIVTPGLGIEALYRNCNTFLQVEIVFVNCLNVRHIPVPI